MLLLALDQCIPDDVLKLFIHSVLCFVFPCFVLDMEHDTSMLDVRVHVPCFSSLMLPTPEDEPNLYCINRVAFCGRLYA